MTFKQTPTSLTLLREEFKKRGLRNQEREITFAIKFTERRNAWNAGAVGKIESIFNLVLFEVTSEYGMSPARPLLILAALLLVFSLPYVIAICRPGQAGIWVVWLEDRINKDESERDPIPLTPQFFLRGSPLSGSQRNAAVRCLRVLRFGLYFSLMSAFHIGWRELNLGTWISRMQAYEYTLKATGWVRFVSGLQSLISVYLLALWLLSYFGRPFE